MSSDTIYKDSKFRIEVAKIAKEFILSYRPAGLDHGLLTGLSDDDHPQYLTQAEADALFLTPTEGNSLYSLLGHDHNSLYYTKSEVYTKTESDARYIAISESPSVEGDMVKIGRPNGYHYRIGTGVFGSTSVMQVYNNATAADMYLQPTNNIAVGTLGVAPPEKLSVKGGIISYYNTLGTYIGLFKDTGILPSPWSALPVPVLKTDYTTLFFSVNGKTSALLNGNTDTSFWLLNDATQTGVRLDSKGVVSAQNNTNVDQGTYLGLFKEQGSLPGYASDYYPTVKTDGSAIYFSAYGKYTGYVGGLHAALGLFNSSVVEKVFLNTNGSSYFTGGNVGIGYSLPGTLLHVKGSKAYDFICYIDNEDANGHGLVIHSANTSRSSLAIQDTANNSSVCQIYPNGNAYFIGNLGIATTPDTTIPLYIEKSINTSVIAYLRNTSSTGYGVAIDGGNNSGNYILSLRNYGAYERFRFRGDGVLTWGDDASNGYLSWDTGRAIVGGLTGNVLSLYADQGERVRIIGQSGYYIQMGGVSYGWSGNVVYPTITSNASDTWVMITHPHIPYLKSGYRGLTSITPELGATVTYEEANNGVYSAGWALGVNPSNVLGAYNRFGLIRETSVIWSADSSGRIGIGIAAPSSALHIYSSSPWIAIDRTSVNAEQGIQFKNNGTPVFYLFNDNNNNDLQFQSGQESDSTPRMRFSYSTGNIYMMEQLSNNGKLGIAYDSPSVRVDIRADSSENILSLRAYSGVQKYQISSNNFYLDTFESFSVTYSAGQVWGNGFKLWKDTDNRYNLQIDNMYIRGELNATVFNIQKIRATNGDLIVSAGAKAAIGIVYDANGAPYFEVAQDNEQTLMAGDILKSATLNGLNIYSNIYVVFATSGRKVYLRAQNGTTIMAGGAIHHSLSNVNADSFTEVAPNVQVYNVTFGAGDYILSSNAFAVKKGYYYITGYGTYTGNALTISLVDSITGSAVSTTSIIYPASSFGSWLTVNTVTNAKLKIHNNNGSGTSTWSGYYINALDYSIIDESIVDQEFVRLGSVSNISRQGVIHISASEPDAPFVEVRDGIDNTVYSTSQIKARMGKLTGLTFNNNSLTGYGFYSDNGYLKGGINASTGLIANWNILQNSLYATSASGSIYLNAAPTIIMNDSAGVQRIIVKPDNMTSLSILVGGSNLGWTSGNTNGADETFTLTYNTSVHPIRYLQQTTAASNTNMSSYTSWQSGKNFTLTQNKTYTLNFKLRFSSDYTLPADDTNNVDLLTYTHSIDGNYTINGTLYLYNSSDNIIYSEIFYTSISPKQGYATPTIVNVYVNDFNGMISTTGVYYKIDYQITSSVQIRKDTTEWENNGIKIYPIYTYTTYHDVDLDVKFEVYSANIDGVVGVTELTGDGLQSVWDADQYISIKKANLSSVFINSAGMWSHYATAGIPLLLNYKNTTSTVPVLTLRHGATSGTGIKLLQAEYTTGVAGGYINMNISTKTLTFVSDSDINLKENIKDSSIDALFIINSIPIRNFNYKDNKYNTDGWIAQEVMEYFPRAVHFDESRNLYGISPESFNVLYFKAIQQLTNKIKELESIILNLK